MKNFPFKNGKRMDKLLKACVDGDLTVIKELSSSGIDVTCRGGLEHAIKNGHIEVIEYLIDLGVNIEKRGYKMVNELINDGNLKMIKYLHSVGVAVRNNETFLLAKLGSDLADYRRKFDERLADNKFKSYRLYPNKYTGIVEYFNSLIVVETKKYTLMLLLGKLMAIHRDLYSFIVEHLIENI